jgi:glycosyltransferase involved in cell wall biosynthesis
MVISLLSKRVSVIIPSFNQGQFLNETIHSVVSQSYRNREVIVIDGGSTDATVQVLEKLSPQINYWVSETDNGQSHAFNKGLLKASGEIIGWLNSDDLYLGESIRGAVEYFDKHPEIDIVFSDYIFIDKDSRFIKRRREIPFSLSVYLWTGDCYHANCAGFFRRRVFEMIGGLDENLHFGMDYEFYLRAATSGCRIGHRRGYWGAYRFHDMSKSVRSFALQRQDAEAIVARYAAQLTGRTERPLMKLLWSSIRVLRKVFLGSYLLAVVQPREWHAR